VEKVPYSHRYRLPPEGYRLGVVYLKLFAKIDAPLTAGLLKPFPPTPGSPGTRSRTWTDSISPSPKLSTTSLKASASKPHDAYSTRGNENENKKRKQSSRFVP
jgi:hypothetical protein